MKSRKLFSSLGAIAIAATALVGSVAPAQASPLEIGNPAGMCNTSTLHHRVETKIVRSTNLGPQIHLDNRKGSNTVTSNVKVGVKGSKSSTLTGTIEGGFSTALYTAKAGVSKAIQKTVSWDASTSVKLTAPKKTIKYAQMTTNMYTVNMSSTRYNSNCVGRVVASSKLIAPSSIGWKTW